MADDDRERNLVRCPRCRQYSYLVTHDGWCPNAGCGARLTIDDDEVFEVEADADEGRILEEEEPVEGEEPSSAAPGTATEDEEVPFDSAAGTMEDGPSPDGGLRPAGDSEATVEP